MWPRGAAIAAALLAAAALSACGGGEQQDANEPEGTFKVEVSRAVFPRLQGLGETAPFAVTVQRATAVSCAGAETRTSSTCPARRRERAFPRARRTSTTGPAAPMLRVVNGQPRPEQVTLTVPFAGIRVTRSVRSVAVAPLRRQPALNRAGLGAASWCSPHGGFALTIRPGTHVATKLAKRAFGWLARTV